MKNNLISRKTGRACLMLLVSLACFCAATQYAPLEEQIPTLRMPQAGNMNTDHIQITLGESAAQALPGNDLPVYRMKAVDAAAERQKISQLFDLEPSEIGGFPHGNTLATGASVGFDAQTGRWFYREAIDWDAADISMISDKEAAEQAKEFIKSNQLYPVDGLGEAKIGETYTGTELEGNKQVLQKTVYFYPSIDGKKVYGNFRIGISFNPQGDIVGVDKFASEYEQVQSISPKTAAAVEQAFLKGDYTLASETIPKKTTIDTVSDAFYADPESAYLQPIYVLEDRSGQASVWMNAE